MGFLYVQTYVVSKGKAKEHDDCIKKMYEMWKDKWKVHGARKEPKLLSQRWGPMGARVFILEFDNYTDYQRFFNAISEDEEASAIREEWLTYIEPITWKAVFWNELMPD